MNYNPTLETVRAKLSDARTGSRLFASDEMWAVLAALDAAEARVAALEAREAVLTEALDYHLSTHNGAPSDPEPLCSCASCHLGRAALSEPSGEVSEPDGRNGAPAADPTPSGSLTSPVGLEDPLVGLPPDLVRVLRDPGIVVAQDQKVWELIASWANAKSDTASAEPSGSAE